MTANEFQEISNLDTYDVSSPTPTARAATQVLEWPQNIAAKYTTPPLNSMDISHLRLNHLHEAAIRTAIKNGLLEGFDVAINRTDIMNL
jgi:hypothetical protein